jgi:hypothetical protein
MFSSTESALLNTTAFSCLPDSSTFLRSLCLVSECCQKLVT